MNYDKEVKKFNTDTYLKMKGIRKWKQPTAEKKIKNFLELELIRDMNIEYAKEGKKIAINNKNKICIVDIKTNKIIE